MTNHVWFPEPLLAFHPERISDRHIHPLRGLIQFGPYSSGMLPDPIRVATIAPHGDSQRLYDFMRQLHSPAKPNERRDYLPQWPGFHSVFGIRMVAAGGQCHLELDSDVDAKIADSESPHVFLADCLTRAINRLGLRRSEFDVLFIYLPRRWSLAFTGSADEDFDLHDYLKAVTAPHALPIQIVREDSALAYPDVASVMWRIGVALYAKAGGIPWKLAPEQYEEETAYIGISYALRSRESPEPHFVTCCSQVFDAQGSGLEFVAYDAHELDVRGDNPFLSRTEMFRVMTRSIDLYRRRHAGRSPRRVMVHKTTEFKDEEVDGCMEALHLCETVDLVQIVEGVPWRGVRIEERSGNSQGAPAHYPVARGTLLDIGPREALLWTHGDVQGISSRGSFFQGGKGTPRPLRLVRHAGHGAWDDTAKAILGLTKMDWNNDSLYDLAPVTIAYAQVLARVIKRMSGLGNSPYQFRFFM